MENLVIAETEIEIKKRILKCIEKSVERYNEYPYNKDRLLAIGSTLAYLNSKLLLIDNKSIERKESKGGKMNKKAINILEECFAVIKSDIGDGEKATEGIENIIDRISKSEGKKLLSNFDNFYKVVCNMKNKIDNKEALTILYNELRKRYGLPVDTINSGKVNKKVIDNLRKIVNVMKSGDGKKVEECITGIVDRIDIDTMKEFLKDFDNFKKIIIDIDNNIEYKEIATLYNALIGVYNLYSSINTVDTEEQPRLKLKGNVKYSIDIENFECEFKNSGLKLKELHIDGIIDLSKFDIKEIIADIIRKMVIKM